MSYSFAVSGVTKSEALAGVVAKFDEVVAAQPTHASDKPAAVAAAKAFIDLLKEPEEGEHITVSMHGSLGWHHTDVPPVTFLSGGVGVSASVQKI